MRYAAIRFTNPDNILYSNYFMLPVIRRAQTMLSVEQGGEEITIVNTETEMPVACVRFCNGEVQTTIF